MRIKLGGLCHMTVHTHAGPQCAAVSTQFEEMRMAPQKPELPTRRAA